MSARSVPEGSVRPAAGDTTPQGRERSPWDPERYEAHLRKLILRNELHVPIVTLPRSRHVLLGSMRLHYLDWGGPSGPPVVLLHGGGLNAHTWDLVALALRPRARCVALDLRGHGESEWSRSLEYTVDTHSEDVVRFLDHLEAEQAVLVGMSLGGIVAMSVALGHPERVGGLALVDVGPPPDPEGVERIEGFMQSMSEFDSIEHAVETALRFNPRRNRGHLTWSLERNLMRLHGGSYTWKYDRRHRMTPDHVQEIVEDNRRLADEVAKLACPMVLAFGEQSDVISADAAEDFVADVPGARAMSVSGAGHTVQGDNPAALVSLLEEFLDEVGPLPASPSEHEPSREP